MAQNVLIRCEFGDTLQNDIEQFNAQVRDNICCLNFMFIFLILITFNDSEICQKLGFEIETIAFISEIHKYSTNHQNLVGHVVDVGNNP